MHTEHQSGGGAVGGFLLTFLLHVAFQGGVLAILAMWDPMRGEYLGGLVYLYPALLIGVSQLVYMAPAFWIARRRGAHGVAKGLALGAAGTVLINSCCWGAALIGG